MLLSALEPDVETLPMLDEDEPGKESLASPLPHTRFGDYELIQELAQGGMGIIYLARQVKLDRMVVVKMLLLGQRASNQVVERFKREAKAAAHLRHPNIVAIHEVGEFEGQPFFSMDYIQGKDLGRIVREGPLPPRKAASYVRAVAGAIHYAHQQGIIHRDLKPSNILVDFATDEVRVTDFGIAKRLDDHSEFTLSGQVMGSPNHMAPELAAGHHRLASPASDVFSLGTVLYELMTGRPPFLAESLQATLLKIRDTDPVHPRDLHAGIPRDLETICLKCLQKEPGSRYATAQEVADELGRFLGGEPIRTRPPGVLGKTWRWCKRKPVVAGMVAAILALTVISTITAVRLAIAQRAQEREQYYAEIGLAKHHIEEGNIDRALELLRHCPPRYRHWEWGHLLYLCHQDILTIPAHTNVLSLVDLRSANWMTAVKQLEFSADSHLLATLGTDGTAKVWDVASGSLRFTSSGRTNAITRLALSPVGDLLAVASDYRLTIHEVPAGNVRIDLPIPAPWVTQLAWHPDGRRLVVGVNTGGVFSLSLTNGESVRQLTGGHGSVRRLFYTRDGRRFVVESDLRCTQFDAESEQEVDSLVLRWGEAINLTADPDGRRFVSQARDSTITVWENAKERQALDKTGFTDNRYPLVFFSPDGRRLVTRAQGGNSRVWDVASRQAVLSIPDQVLEAVFSPDGRRLITTGITTTAHVWDIDDGREVRALRGHEELIELVAFSPDGRLVATSARDGVIKLWSATDGREVSSHDDFVWATTISRDGRRFTTGPVVDGITVRDTRSGRGFLKIHVEGDYLNAACFSPDGTRLLTCSRFRQPRVWDLESGKLRFTLEGHTRAAMWGMAWSPDGRVIATTSYDRTARLWDATTGRPLLCIADGVGLVEFGLAFSPDSRSFVTVSSIEPEAKIWDVSSGRRVQTIHAHDGGCAAALFSPDGSQVVTAGLDNTIRFWRVGSGQLEKELRLRGFANMMAFSPDGRRLFVRSNRMGVMGTDVPAFEVWDVEAGRQILTLTGHRDIGSQLAISGDGRQVITSGGEGTVRQWQIFPWLEAEYPGAPDAPFAIRARDYADQYWRQRLADETEPTGVGVALKLVEIPFDRSLIPSRDSNASPRMIDLTRFYTSPLSRTAFPVFGGQLDDDLRNLPPGIAEYGGVNFDARGVIQLSRSFQPGSPFDLHWHQVPTRVNGIPIGRPVRRLHLFLGTVGPESEGTGIGALVWHFADGQHSESEIVYGRHVRDWWKSMDGREAVPGGRIAWRGTNPSATDDTRYRAGKEPGDELRLYTSSWDNPRPGVEVTRVDLVSRDTLSAPFVVAITVE